MLVVQLLACIGLQDSCSPGTERGDRGMDRREPGLHSVRQGGLMGTQETPLQMALRHVREGEEHIARQRVLIAELKAGGHPTADAEALLTTFESSQHEHVDHLKKLLSGERKL